MGMMYWNRLIEAVLALTSGHDSCQHFLLANQTLNHTLAASIGNFFLQANRLALLAIVNYCSVC